MTKLLALLGMIVGSWVGWALGAPISIFTAFMLSIVGTGVGLWAGRWISSRYF